VDNCEKCGSDNMKVGWACITSGATVFPWYCANCNFVFAKYVKKETAEKLHFDSTHGEVKLVKTRTQEYMDKKGIKIICEVCNLNEGELHHWAPQYLFQDADQWPTSYLCRTCHKKWHDLVTPNMAKRG
jgi:protein-arginine kinase activator protein McsA